MAEVWQFSYTPYVWPLLLSAMVLGAVMVLAWRFRSHPAGTAFALVMTALLIWTLGFALELLAATLTGKLLWANVQFIGITTLPVAWLAMTLAYIGHAADIERLVAPALGVPVLTNLVIWTNPLHHLFRGRPALEIGSAPFAVLVNDYGPWFYWLHAPYGYLLFAASFYLLLRTLAQGQAAYRRQIGVLMLATGFPLLLDLLYVLGVTPVPHFNLTTLAFGLAGVVLAWDMLRYRFLDVMPVARGVLVETMEDAWLVLDRAGRLSDLNAAAEAIIGRPASYALGLPAERVLADRPALLERLSGAQQAHFDIELEMGAQVCCYDVRVTPLRRRGGLPEGRLVVLRDVTGRRQVEQALQRANQLLRNEVSARELLITDLDAFARTVAHDLKNPVGAIAIASEELASGTLGPLQSAGLAAIVHDSACRARNIIDELLTLASIGRREVETEPLLMGAVVQDVEQRLTYLFRETGAELVYPSEWPLALGHAPWVEEVWSNYISNGCKYGGQPPRLVLGADRRPDGMLRFWLRDNGDGLSAEQKAQLFTEFTRLAPARARGHGLGLAIVKRIVEKLGGEVGVESEQQPGKGCTFWFTLPAAPEAGQTGDQVVASPPEF